MAIPVIEKYVSSRLGKPVPADFSQRIEDRLLAIYENDLPRIPGAEDLLRHLQAQGVTMAIATGGSLRRMRTTLRLSGLGPWFEGTACSAEEVPDSKPAPDLFLLALERLQARAEDCMVVEDSPHGANGAAEAGVEGRRAAHAAALRAADAVAVCERLEDVARFLSDRLR